MKYKNCPSCMRRQFEEVPPYDLAWPIQRRLGVVADLYDPERLEGGCSWCTDMGAGRIMREAAAEIESMKRDWDVAIAKDDEALAADRAVERALGRIEGAPQWIPLSERIPTEEGRYAILYRYKQTGIVKAFIGDFLGDGWSCDLRDSTITHWMPLPEAPK